MSVSVSTQTLRPGRQRSRTSAFGRLAGTELKLFVREPLTLFWGFVFPLVLLILIGSSGSEKPQHSLGGMRFIDAYVPVLMVFVLAILALNALPAALSNYRDKGYLRRLSTTPVGPVRVIGVQLAINLGVSAGAMAVLVAVGKLAFHVALPAQLAGFVVSLIFGATAMLGLGTLVSAVVPNQRLAGLVGSLLFFPMMFFAGLWGPRAQMGPGLRHVSDFTPLGATVAAVQDSIGGHWPHLEHLGVLAAYTVLFAVAAVRLFRWER